MSPHILPSSFDSKQRSAVVGGMGDGGGRGASPGGNGGGLIGAWPGANGGGKTGGGDGGAGGNEGGGGAEGGIQQDPAGLP